MTMTRDDLAGTWRMVSEEEVHADGRISYPFGHDRLAQIIYSPDGFMSVVATDAVREKVTDKCHRMDLDAASPEERARAAVGCVAYAGRYEVEGDKVRHHVDMALNPNVVGVSRMRSVALDGDDLTLTTPADKAGTFGRIRWRRIR
jgi:Mg-chelatase subunit ChlI